MSLPITSSQIGHDFSQASYRIKTLADGIVVKDIILNVTREKAFIGVSHTPLKSEIAGRHGVPACEARLVANNARKLVMPFGQARVPYRGVEDRLEDVVARGWLPLGEHRHVRPDPAPNVPSFIGSPYRGTNPCQCGFAIFVCGCHKPLPFVSLCDRLTRGVSNMIAPWPVDKA